VACLLHRNDWHVQHARRLLQERAVARKLDPATPGQIWKIFDENPDPTRKLRALWALHAAGGLSDKQFLGLASHAHEAVRAWAVQLVLDRPTASATVRQRLAEMAVQEESPFVRLALASGLQRLPGSERWPIAEGLAGHTEDIPDTNVPLMIWYGI